MPNIGGGVPQSLLDVLRALTFSPYVSADHETAQVFDQGFANMPVGAQVLMRNGLPHNAIAARYLTQGPVNGTAGGYGARRFAEVRAPSGDPRGPNIATHELMHHANDVLRQRYPVEFGQGGNELTVALRDPHMLSQFAGVHGGITRADVPHRTSTTSDELRSTYAARDQAAQEHGLQELLASIFEPQRGLDPRALEKSQPFVPWNAPAIRTLLEILQGLR